MKNQRAEEYYSSSSISPLADRLSSHNSNALYSVSPAFAKRHLIAVTALLVVCSASAQSPKASSIDTAQGKVLIPISTGILGQRDPAALTELTSHLSIVSPDIWKGMKASGKITYGSKDPNSYDATLYNLGANAFRLDAQTRNGEMSVRIHGHAGKIKNDNGTVSAIATDTAPFELFPFETIRAKQFPLPNTSVIDHGLTVIDGIELHRITYEFAGAGNIPGTKSKRTLATDLYFDPTSHLLIKSVASVQIDPNSHVKLLSVVSYSDYRKVDNAMIPFRYTETMEGGQTSSPWYQQDTCYDTNGRVNFQALPYQGTGGATNPVCSGSGVSTAYDGLDRATTVSNADGSVRYAYNGRARACFINTFST